MQGEQDRSRADLRAKSQGILRERPPSFEGFNSVVSLGEGDHGARVWGVRLGLLRYLANAGTSRRGNSSGT